MWYVELIEPPRIPHSSWRCIADRHFFTGVGAPIDRFAESLPLIAFLEKIATGTLHRPARIVMRQGSLEIIGDIALLVVDFWLFVDKLECIVIAIFACTEWTDIIYIAIAAKLNRDAPCRLQEKTLNTWHSVAFLEWLLDVGIEVLIGPYCEH